MNGSEFHVGQKVAGRLDVPWDTVPTIWTISRISVRSGYIRVHETKDIFDKNGISVHKSGNHHKIIVPATQEHHDAIRHNELSHSCQSIMHRMAGLTRSIDLPTLELLEAALQRATLDIQKNGKS